MINNQTFDIDEWVIVNGCSTDEDHDKFNEEIKLVETDKCDIIIASDKNLSPLCTDIITEHKGLFLIDNFLIF